MLSSRLAARLCGWSAATPGSRLPVCLAAGLTSRLRSADRRTDAPSAPPASSDLFYICYCSERKSPVTETTCHHVVSPVFSHLLYVLSPSRPLFHDALRRQSSFGWTLFSPNWTTPVRRMTDLKLGAWPWRDYEMIGRGQLGEVSHPENTCGSCRLLTAALSPFHKLPETHGRGGQRTVVAIATADSASPSVYLDTFCCCASACRTHTGRLDMETMLYALIF